MLESLNGEVERRVDVHGVFPSEASIIRLVGALLLEQDDEWAIQRRRDAGTAGGDQRGSVCMLRAIAT